MSQLVVNLKLRFTEAAVFLERTVAESFNILGNNKQSVGGLCLESLIR